MTAAVIIILSALAAVLLLVCILQHHEMRSITLELRTLKEKNTNSLVHSSTGTADRLITEINGLLKEIRSSRVSYERKSHALEQMMTNISHDLRTPLTSALGYINIIQHSDISAEEKERELAIIEKRLLRLEELLDSFFELSKMISGGRKPKADVLNLVSVLEEAVVHYYDDYTAAGRQIMLDSPVHRLKICSDSGLLMRIFDNLINNALKHGTGDLSIKVIPGETVSIVFRNGIGTPAPDLSHVFDEFYTTDISRTRGNTGLGLAIAKQFTEMLGGSISAARDGEDFIMTVMLPAQGEQK